MDHQLPLNVARRTFLRQGSLGLGLAAFASLLDTRGLGPAAVRANESGASPEMKPLGELAAYHYPPRIKRVIWLCMAGGPSHLETLDWKPKLAEMHGQKMPESYTAGMPIAQLQGQELKCYAPQFAFKRHGQSGNRLCELFPEIGTVADELCIVNSLKTEAINHDPAHSFMNTGSSVGGRPSMGSWITYGLGAETQDLPGFVVMVSTGKGGQMQPIASRQWHSGFLPSKYQGVQFRGTGDPVMYVSRPPGIEEGEQRDVIDAVNSLNRMLDAERQDPEIAARVAQYELAFRMQASVPELMDLSGETQETLDAYGAKPGDGSFASNCLLARRLAERGTRFIQLYHRDWDHHGGIKQNMEVTAAEVDRGTAALIKDLKQRGMLDETLVVWCGEFGRTPMGQGSGRDHHIKGFSCFLAGGGIKGGITYGATDELGYSAVENVVHVHDLHATMLSLLGVDHERLTYRVQGRDFRLTDVFGHVVKDILA
ncbi:MAG TPA: DUF1501 domain-containing protein [Pirellulaceae bacterium]|jgi:hypothetical protein|nr:DUF1501 domain-containing protein [Pirellulaceae bacterium]